MSKIVVEDYSQMIQKKIDHARLEARTLYKEVEIVKTKVKDTNLKQQSEQMRVQRIPNHSINPKLYTHLEGHQSKISQLQWNSNSNQILSASQDGYMIIWDSVTGYKKQAIELDNQWVLTCALSPNNEYIASGGLDNNLTIYRVNSDKVLQRQRQAGMETKQISSATTPGYPLTPAMNRSNGVQHIFKKHRAYISDCKFLNNQQIITGSGDMKAIMWDLNKGGEIRDFLEHTGDILCLDTFDKSQQTNNLFVSGSCDGYCKLWDLRTRSSVQNLFISNYDINSVRIFPQGQSFITGLDDGTIRLFDIRSDCELSNYSILGELKRQNLQANNNFNFGDLGGMGFGDTPKRQSLNSVQSTDAANILSVDFSKSGRLIYCCYSDFGCLIWDILKSEIVGSIGGHLNKINQVSVSPDGIGICTASWDSTINVWAP